MFTSPSLDLSFLTCELGREIGPDGFCGPSLLLPSLPQLWTWTVSIEGVRVRAGRSQVAWQRPALPAKKSKKETIQDLGSLIELF